MKTKFLLSLFLLSIGVSNYAQDTIFFRNGDKIIGELKSLDKGVITIETDYSDSDFKIEWKGVDKLTTGTHYLITTSDGVRYSGKITEGDSTGFTINDNGQQIRVPADDIVHLLSVDKGFWSKLYANIDVGLNLTKANNLSQFTINSGIGYNGEKWAWNARFNALSSSQDSVPSTQRLDGGLTVNRYLQHDIFLTASTDYLSNTEQLLNLRSNFRAGAGYYFVHSNTWYWNFSVGVGIIEENYSNGENNKESAEAFLATELNLFDFGDLSFFTKIVAYPSLTEAGRFRSDINMDFKYDLPLDFYIKTGLTVNYDNQPTVGASELDYVLNTGFGWEW